MSVLENMGLRREQETSNTLILFGLLDPFFVLTPEIMTWKQGMLIHTWKSGKLRQEDFHEF